MLINRISQVPRIPQYRIWRLKITKYRKKNCSIPQYRKPQCFPQYTRTWNVKQSIYRNSVIGCLFSSLLLQTRDVSSAAAHFQREFTSKRPFAVFWVIFWEYYILMVWYNILKQNGKYCIPLNVCGKRWN